VLRARFVGRIVTLLGRELPPRGVVVMDQRGLEPGLPLGLPDDARTVRSKDGAAEVAAPGELHELGGERAAALLLRPRPRVLEHDVGGDLLDHEPRVVADVGERRAHEHRGASGEHGRGAERAGAVADRGRQLAAARRAGGAAREVVVGHGVAAFERAAAGADEPDGQARLAPQEVEQRGVAAAGAEPLEQAARARQLQPQARRKIDQGPIGRFAGIAFAVSTHRPWGFMQVR